MGEGRGRGDSWGFKDGVCFFIFSNFLNSRIISLLL